MRAHAMACLPPHRLDVRIHNRDFLASESSVGLVLRQAGQNVHRSQS